MFCLLHSDVVLVCQCQTGDVQNEFARMLCSSTQRSRSVDLCILPHGHKSVMVSSFHPMHFARMERSKPALKRAMREYLFDATFITAVNALAGRRVSGLGLANLRACAANGPAIKCTPDGVRISYQWVDDDIAPIGLLKCLRNLNLESTVIRSKSPGEISDVLISLAG